MALCIFYFINFIFLQIQYLFHLIPHKMKKIIPLLLLLFLQSGLIFRSNAQQVITTAGDYFEGDNFSLSWTLGETVIETFTGNDIIFTQGFQQPYNFYLTQLLNIPKGWSGVSGFIDPLNKDLENLFASHSTDFTLLATLNQFYYPAGNTNTIGSWYYDFGYKIKAQEDFLLSLSGTKVADPTVALSQGWNLIPVLSSCGASTSAVFGPMTDLLIAKEVAGTQVYWPQYGINTLNALMPGKAYLVKMNVDNSFTYPACAKAGNILPAANDPVRNVPWNEVAQTGSSHVIAVPAKVLAQVNAQPGDVLAVFTPEGICVGNQSLVSLSQSLSLVAFADDAITPQKDGFAEGQQIILKLYRPSGNQLMDLLVEFEPALPNTNAYAPEGLSAVKSATISASAVHDFAGPDIRIYPNPSQGRFTLVMKHWLENLQIRLYDTRGNFIKQFDPGLQEAGAKYPINVSSLPPGVYYLKFIHPSFLEIQKIIIQ